ncbi:YcxB family protein [Brevundimonas sp.]|uniref:YcxB family protein n=1 Tax=Brevundimonas sp. TaxID=1871086 RepID=UPI0025E246C6|nr:YcxB family protein [Brevundimonas sp.]
MIEVPAVQPTGEELRSQLGDMTFTSFVELAYRLIGPFGLVLLFAFGLRYADRDQEKVLFAIFVATYVLSGLIGWWLRSTFRRAIKRAPLANQPVDWTLSTEGIGLKAPSMTAHLAWAAVSGIRESRRSFEFRAPPGSDLVLPKRSLAPAQVDELRRLVRQIQAQGWAGSLKLKH